VLSYDLLAKNDFIAFPVGFGDTVLKKNNGMQMFLTLGDLLLPWERKCLRNKLHVAITAVSSVYMC